MKYKTHLVTVIFGCADNIDTHSTRWFSKVWDDFKDNLTGSDGCDPFARDCKLATFTNDINPMTAAEEHKPALEFLQQFKTGSLDFVIFDPPFSERQSHEKYDGFGINLYASEGVMIGECLDEASRILKTGGRLLKFGYNCNTFNHSIITNELCLIIKNKYNNQKKGQKCVLMIESKAA